MPTLRVTQGLMVMRALNNLNTQTRRLLPLQEQLATGQKVNAPSDGPLAVRRAINIRAAITRNEQYLTNISSAGPQLLETVTAVQTVVSSMQRAHELTIQGANGTYSQAQLDDIAIEVDQILEGVIGQANHQTNGKYVFGGTRTLVPPFDVTRDAQGRITAVTYQGNNENVEIAVAEGISVVANEPGSNVFQATQDVFQLLIDIRDNLLAGDQESLQTDRLVEIKEVQDQLLMSEARVGATQNRLERLTNNLYEHIQQLRETYSDNVDADYAETVINLNAQTNAFQAALSAAARVIQPSLLDYVR